MTKRKFIIGTSSLLLVVAICVSLYVAWPYIKGWSSTDDVFQYINYSSTDSDETTQEAENLAHTTFPSVDWEGLKSVNPDVIGWINVPGTRVDYAICQAPKEDPQKYLHTDLQGNYNVYGVPYLDWEMKTLGSFDARSCLIYGHHMINGTMFSDMAKMAKEEYAREHQQILLMRPEGNRELKVVAVNVVNANKEKVYPTFATEEMLQEYMQEKLGECEVILDAELATSASRIYSFVTCSYGQKNERTIVYAAEVYCE
jgi:sortase B